MLGTAEMRAEEWGKRGNKTERVENTISGGKQC